MSISSEVGAFFTDLGHPLKNVMLAVREAILDADARIAESFK